MADRYNVGCNDLWVTPKGRIRGIKFFRRILVTLVIKVSHVSVFAQMREFLVYLPNLVQSSDHS